ncbi:MAG: hypothetical protein UW75_C0058G0002 [Parcubacteria group bacterium GW2011_GWF2_44_8]|nr:MAG: hypothetical protein UW75_C0058G0002 [Parcubacteria group bacterium GW2011_GWF2_44_8]
MNTFLEVIKDLWQFALEQLSFSDSTEVASTTRQTVNELKPAPVVQIARPDTEKRIALPLHTAGTGVYVSVPEASVFYRPVLTYDGVVRRLPYATGLTVLGFEGRFARVVVGDTTGFVLKDDITEQKKDIFPEFLSEEIYSNNHPDTKKVRTYLKDEFFAEPLYLPLQAVEFVLYRLRFEGRDISWPSERPRLAGRWQTILKGRTGIQIGVMPKASAVMEFLKPDGTGFVGYTKAVHVDDSIVLQGVGRLIEGEYREEIVSKEVWHEWRPVWISVS